MAVPGLACVTVRTEHRRCSRMAPAQLHHHTIWSYSADIHPLGVGIARASVRLSAQSSPCRDNIMFRAPPGGSLLANGLYSVNDVLLLSKDQLRAMKPPIKLGAFKNTRLLADPGTPGMVPGMRKCGITCHSGCLLTMKPLIKIGAPMRTIPQSREHAHTQGKDSVSPPVPGRALSHRDRSAADRSTRSVLPPRSACGAAAWRAWRQ